MHDVIEIGSNNERVLINPNGAWVERLDSGEGSVLFPKSTLIDATGAEKARGGMHVCLPNFGPGGESGLAQHGFGRISTWTVLQQDATSVTLELKVTEGNYTGLVAELQYKLGEKSLTASLSLSNSGAAPLRVAPGFHPYFALEASEAAVPVNGESFNLDELSGTEYREAESVELITATQHIIMNTENLSTWAIWTDQLGDYVCVEPTLGGNRFLESTQPDEQLSPGETKRYSVTTRW